MRIHIMDILSSLKESSSLKYIQNIGRKVLGINKKLDEIDTLFYFLNTYCDITKLPPTQDKDLRNVQILLLWLMRIFDKECKKYNLTYWLESGNLLGAVRHKGFIPWDDDADVGMPREDYNKVIPLMKEELHKYGIIVRSGGYFDNRGSIERLAISYKTLETGGWIDIFPIDTITVKSKEEEGIKEATSLVKRYVKYYVNHINNSQNEILNVKEKIFSRYSNGKEKICVLFPEFHRKDYVISFDSIYPLKSIEYEGINFPIPKDSYKYLELHYGKDYMKFPRSGVEHHLDLEGNCVKTRAQRNGVDMEKEIAYLQSVYNRI